MMVKKDRNHGNAEVFAFDQDFIITGFIVKP
jgi:hypothetical protein